MAVSPGWATLGNTIAGGNSLNQATAYERGAQMSAQTADALEQARSRRDENVARAGIYEKLDNITDPAERAATAALIQAHVNPGEVANSQKTNQEVRFRNDIVNPDTSDTAVGRRALALNQKGPIQSLGEGNVINELHPVDTATGAPAVVPTAIGTAIAGQHNASTQNQLAEAALHRDQVVNPQKYRTGIAPPAGPPGSVASDGSKPLPNDATLLSIARGNSPAPIPGSLNYNRLGGEDAMRRIEYFARNPNAVIGGPPAAPVSPPAAAPTVPVPGAAPAANSEIKLPDAAPAAPPGVGSTFDSTKLAQRRTAQNDLARKNGTGGSDDALNRVAGHLDVYEQLMSQSHNSDFVASNQLKNWFQQQTGKAWPGSAALAAQVLSTELIKSMANNSIGGVDERLDLAKRFANTNSVEQANGPGGVIDAAQRLLREQAVATNQRITASGVKDYYGTYLTPTTRRRLSLGEFDKASAPPAVTPAAGAVDPSDPLGIRVKK